MQPTPPLITTLSVGACLVDPTREWNDWYAWAVPLADDLYDEYLRELGEEGLI